MNNLDIIKAAAKMGYSAVIYFNGQEVGDIVDVASSQDSTRVVLRESDWFGSYRELSELDLEELDIDSFIFVGHLFGEPVIPEGQKFRVKGKGITIFFLKGRFRGVPKDISYPMPIKDIDLSELEPVFE